MVMQESKIQEQQSPKDPSRGPQASSAAAAEADEIGKHASAAEQRRSSHQGVHPNPQALPGVACVVVLGSEPVSPGLRAVTGQCSQRKDSPAGEHWQVCDQRTACEPACSGFGSAQCAGNGLGLRSAWQTPGAALSPLHTRPT
ncbi:hypothetical protein J1605_021245 [Eschrichtius robustus]|uniref:Uncharacterized protein n=1 Tax=Eschrichtius robustus TaxID=9764 RepID=A0AB34HD98_ESCRO|nr:hypothetical protein J1605_021245 [Eschrichtius robustus]